MRVLVVGATGLLGRHIVASAPAGVEVVGVSRTRPLSRLAGHKWLQLDLLNPSAVKTRITEFSPDIVIHAGGESRVDAARDDEVATRASIVDGTSNLIDALQSASAKLVYISSNAVFGEPQGAIYSDSPYGPVNSYGQLKVEAEQEVLARLSDSLVVRPLLTYGWSSEHQRRNVVEIWLKDLFQGREIRALTDVSNQPLYAFDCASSIWSLALGEKTRVANIGGPTELSMYSFALIVADVFGADRRLVRASTIQELGLAAKRVSRVVFAREDFPELLDRVPVHPDDGLNEMRLAMANGEAIYTSL